MKQSVITLIASLVVVGMIVGCVRSQQEMQDESTVVAATITTDCIVHYYKTNASAYITQQKHGYNPLEGFFEAVSTEPGGRVQCTLHKGKYTSSGLKDHRLSDLPDSFWSKNLAVAVFYSFCAGGDLLETESIISAEKVKIEGQWYKALKPQWPGGLEVTLLQSFETKRMELIRLEDEQVGLVWLLKSYNFRYNKDLSSVLPRSIDVFDIRDGVASKELMIRFDYIDIQKVGK